MVGGLLSGAAAYGDVDITESVITARCVSVGGISNTILDFQPQRLLLGNGCCSAYVAAEPTACPSVRVAEEGSWGDYRTLQLAMNCIDLLTAAISSCTSVQVYIARTVLWILWAGPSNCRGNNECSMSRLAPFLGHCQPLCRVTLSAGALG
jgi:hypothetical protein